ncbi:hypothetical protein [Caulobacter sp.]|uniref:hypothetical protein n=1 Tax=Caulobacter sp. TaxID=78 RepID=UPI003BAC3285
MITADDHWPATLQRVVAALQFRVKDPKAVAPVMAIEMRHDVESLPALIQTAMRATIEIDDWVAKERIESPVNREAVITRKTLARALAADAQSPLTMGYETAYRVKLEGLMWEAIKDYPRRRLEELAGMRA